MKKNCFRLLSLLALWPITTYSMTNLGKQLIDAVNIEDIVQVKNLLEQGTDIDLNSFNADKYIKQISQGKADIIDTLLVLKNNIKIFQLFIQHGFTLNDNEGCLCLWHAVKKNNDTLAAFLLENGADPNSNNSTHSVLEVAISKGNNKLVELLIKNGANIHEVIANEDFNKSSLYWAVRAGIPSIVKVLLDYGAETDKAPYLHITITPDKFFIKDYPDLKFKFDENLKDYISVAKLLLEKDSKLLSQKDSKGRTPFAYALQEGNTKMASLVLNYLLKFNNSNQEQDQQLVLTQEILALISPNEIGAKDNRKRIRIQKTYSRTIENYTNVQTALLTHDAQLLGKALRNEAYITPAIQVFIDTLRQKLFSAIKKHDIQTIKALLKSLFSIHTKDKDGNTLWHIACNHGNVEIIKILLAFYPSHKAFNTKNKAGLTPLEYAINSSNNGILQFLIDEFGKESKQAQQQNQTIDTKRTRDS